ncbi:MAG: carbon storage regulator [Ruminococcaceae bacterium]|jgi:carbon storage regulator|nr:carbon storage regulator [Oscillospiraceae bacterium]
MLILRRRAGETLLIGDDVKITVMDVYEGGVRLAIDAPKSIPVLRSELLQAVDANRDAAAKSASSRPDSLLGMLGSVPDDKKQPL